MDRETPILRLPYEIELLARLHLIYGLLFTPAFHAQKEKVVRIVTDYRINFNTEIDPISKILYRRYN